MNAELSTCGCAAGCACCEGRTLATPLPVTNPPGLAAIAYRVGTHGNFKQSMLRRLSGPGSSALAGLRTQDDGDFSIALLDAWATVADVLTFYQERIANESYLRTATERRSLLELGRLIGYQLRPGVAASTFLAFTVEDSPGVPSLAPKRAPIEKGTRVLSIPAPGQTPVTFETLERIEARVDWNAMKPRLSVRHPIVTDTQEPLLFEGLATGLRPGDGLLLDDGTKQVLRQVSKVTLQPARQRTEVLLDGPASLDPPRSPGSGGTFTPKLKLGITSITALSSSRGVSTASIQGKVTAGSFRAAALIADFRAADVFTHLAATRNQPPSVKAFRTRASIFGHNAPDWHTLPVSQRVGVFGPDTSHDPTTGTVFIAGEYAPRKDKWAEESLANYNPDQGGRHIYLDSIYPAIIPKSSVALKDGNTSQVYAIDAVAEESLADFTLSAKVTRLLLKDSGGFEKFKIRATTVFAQAEELTLARLPIEAPVADSFIELDTWVDGLSVGQSLIVCGELSNLRGVNACEHVTLSSIEHVLDAEGFTRLGVGSLVNSYVRASVSIYGNVARASHGETVQEVLGSGTASQTFQQYVLRQPPLTYVKAATPSGAQAALEVRVNDLLWREVPALYGCSPDDHVFVTRIEDDGTTGITFGDGKSGARLPTGKQNVRATYRKGIGTAGVVEAGQLSMLLTRPLGIKAVINPLDAEGAADRETLRDARRNAPLTVLTLERVVSLRDYQDFACSFAGIAKALATWSWDGRQRSVFITVASNDGPEVRGDGETHEHLLTALAAAGDPFPVLRVQSCRRAFFRVEGSVKVRPEYVAAQVLSAIDGALRESFSFVARSFGQPVMLSEVIGIMQSVPGVVAVEVDAFYRTDDPARPIVPRLDAAFPVSGGGAEVAAAELLTLDPTPLELGVMP